METYIDIETYMLRTAIISECGTYRYTLSRCWDPPKPSCAFVMLNPSTADATQDDPTIRRCIGFAKAWGYGGVDVLNLFALRATDPSALRSHPDPIGPDNDEYLRSLRGRFVVAAWGVHGALNGRGEAVRKMLGDRLAVLGLTKDGHPRHPLFVRGDTPPMTWTA